jgi:hypothetical protein
MEALEVNLEAVVPERLLMADRGLSRGGIAVGDFGIRWRKRYKKAKRPQKGRSLRFEGSGGSISDFRTTPVPF